MLKKIMMTLRRFDTISECDGRTDGQNCYA